MTFMDKQGRTWVVELNVGLIQIIRNLLGVDLLAIIRGDVRVLQRIKDDQELIVNILYIICKEQCEKLGLDDLGFATIFGHQTLEDGRIALQEAILSFSPASRQEMLRGAAEQMEMAERDIIEIMTRKMHSVSENAKSEVIQSIGGGSFTESLVSSS